MYYAYDKHLFVPNLLRCSQLLCWKSLVHMWQINGYDYFPCFTIRIWVLDVCKEWTSTPRPDLLGITILLYITKVWKWVLDAVVPKMTHTTTSAVSLGMDPRVAFSGQNDPCERGKYSKFYSVEHEPWQLRYLHGQFIEHEFQLALITYAEKELKLEVWYGEPCKRGSCNAYLQIL